MVPFSGSPALTNELFKVVSLVRASSAVGRNLGLICFISHMRWSIVSFLGSGNQILNFSKSFFIHHEKMISKKIIAC